MIDQKLTAAEILAHITDEVIETLNARAIGFPSYFNAPAVSFIFYSRYIKKDGNVSKGVRTHNVYILEDPVFPGQFTLHVNYQVKPSGNRNLLNERGLSADRLNSTLLNLVP